jgi:hypothetical protein
MTKTFITKQLFIVMLFVALSAANAFAQGTGFSFQGRLNDGTNPANGRYDLQFSLFDAIAGGMQTGTTITRPNTVLINGVFSVTLDFGANVFNNPNAVFIEIGVKPNGSTNAFTILGPRQQLTVVPYAVRSNNASNADNSLSLGGQPASNYVRLSAINTGTLNIEGDTTATGITTARNIIATQSFETPGVITATGNIHTVSHLTAGGNSSVIGNSTVGGNSAVTGNSTVGGKLTVTGNTVQPVGAYGLPKAMIEAGGFVGGSVSKCYNGVTNTPSSQLCGFTFTSVGSGIYRINFGFPVSNLFVTVAGKYASNNVGIGNNNISISYRQFDNTSIDFFTWSPGNSADTIPAIFTAVLY